MYICVPPGNLKKIFIGSENAFRVRAILATPGHRMTLYYIIIIIDMRVYGSIRVHHYACVSHTRFRYYIIAEQSIVMIII